MLTASRRTQPFLATCLVPPPPDHEGAPPGRACDREIVSVHVGMDAPYVCKHCNAPFQDAAQCRSYGATHAADCPRFATAEAEVERLRKALQEAELRIREQVRLGEEQLRRKDEQICRLTLQLQPELTEATNTVAVEFADEGALGLVTDELQPVGSGVYVVGVKPAGQAARIPQVQPGMRIVGVAGRSCANMRYRDVTRLIKSHTARPLIITFALPDEPPSIGGVPDPDPRCEPEPRPRPNAAPDAAIISEGVPPPSAPPPVAMLRRLSADAGRIVANLNEWREQRRGSTDNTGILAELISAGFPPWKCRLALAQTAMRTASGEKNAALEFLERHQDGSDDWWRTLQTAEDEALSPVGKYGGNWVDVET